MWKNPYLEEALNIGGQANKEATTLGKSYQVLAIVSLNKP